MSAAAILAIIQLASSLAPPTIELVQKMILAFESSKLTDDQRLEMLNALQGSLKPMELKA
jgi:hypothetical protein